MKVLLDVFQAFLILAPVAFGHGFENNVSKYEGAQRINIEKTPVAANMLKETNLDVWSANSTFYDVLVKKQQVDEVKQLLRSLNILYSEKDTNVAETLQKRNLGVVLNRSYKHCYNVLFSDPNTPTFNCYPKLDEIHDYLDHLANSHSEVASIDIIGYTGKGKPLKMIKISSGKENAKAFLIDGGIHAREWVAHAAVTFIIKQLVENRTHLPSELLNLDFYILPVFNPDGYEYTYKEDRLWRKNRSNNGYCHGVDINRNFPIRFGGKGTSGNPCKETYRGRRAGSEKETQAFVNFVGNIKEKLAGYVTFHSYGQYILIPFGYDVGSHPPDFEELKTVGDEAAAAMEQVDGKIYTVGNTAEVLYPAAGGSDDWIKAATKAKYVYTIELRDKGEYGFDLPRSLIIPTAWEAMEAIKVIAAAAYRDQTTM